MPTRLAKHKIVISNVPYVFMAPKGLYTGDVGTECGVALVTEAADEALPVIPVPKLLQSKVGKRLTLKVKKGTVIYRLKIVVASNKVATAETALVTKTILTEGAVSNGGTIADAYQPLKASSY